MRTAARRMLGSKKRKVVKKIKKRGKAVKIKLKIKGSATGVTNAVKKLAGGIGDSNQSAS